MRDPYYQNNLVTLHHGDCLAVMDELRASLAGQVGMLFTDPPYGIGELPWDKPVDWPAFFAAHKGFCRRNAAKVFFCNLPCAVALYEANRKEYRYDLVYKKSHQTGHLNCNRQFLRSHENILVFYERQPVFHRTDVEGFEPYCRGIRRRVSTSHSYGDKESAPIRNAGTRIQGSVLECSNGYHTKSHHGTEKTLSALELLICSYTNPGDLVLDPFAGSGSTGVAALRLGRRCVLVEKEEQYCETAARRLEAALSESLGQ